MQASNKMALTGPEKAVLMLLSLEEGAAAPIVAELEDRKKHRRYAKVLRSTSKVKVHDENNEAGVGDRVTLMETRPLSATKRWRLVKIVEKAK